jgi:hypothetical protein
MERAWQGPASVWLCHSSGSRTIAGIERAPDSDRHTKLVELVNARIMAACEWQERSSKPFGH